MDTNQFTAAVVSITTDPSIQSAFNVGLGFGVTVLVGCFGFAMFRVLYDDGKEEL
jgi:hypothetical protein